MKAIVLQKYANREIRFGWQDLPSSRPKATDKQSVITSTKEAELVALCAVQSYKTPSGVYLYDSVKPSLTKVTQSEHQLHQSQVSRSLDITSEFRRGRSERRNHKKIPGTPNRATVFGANARHTLLEAGSVAERWGGNVQNSVIVTLTLPGSTTDAYDCLASWSGYACDRLFRILRKAKSGIRWFYVWELQKRGALHMHLCITAQSPDTSLHFGKAVISKWEDVLRDIGLRSGVDLFLHSKGDRCTIRGFWQNNIQQCKRSVAAYFAKYASKEARSAKKGFSGGLKDFAFYPSRWWGCQRVLRQEIEKQRFKIRIEGLEEQDVAQALILVDNWCEEHNPVKRYRYDFELSYVCNEKTRALGYGERHVVYFDDSDFSHVCNEVNELAQYLVHMCNGSYVQCNRMSALRTPVAC